MQFRTERLIAPTSFPGFLFGHHFEPMFTVLTPIGAAYCHGLYSFTVVRFA